MRILLSGKNGQMGWALQSRLAGLGEVYAMDRVEMDLNNPDTLRTVVRRHRPDLIVNCAAYTAVDRAESEPDLAQAVNATAPGILAEEAKKLGALLLHYSTDYVFDGRKNAPYAESDPVAPLNVYGRTKLEGEQAIAAAGCRHLILRTSWVYGAHGRNFLLSVLRLGRERPELRIVNDQIGAPTWSESLADMSIELLKAEAEGLFHATDGGETSWHGFASEILRLGGVATPVLPIPSEDYPTPAQRPRNSRLDNGKRVAAGGTQRPWNEALAACMKAV